MSHPPSNGTDDLTRLLVDELRVRRQELNNSKENERLVIEKLLDHYKQRAHDAEAKQKDIEAQNENTFSDTASNLDNSMQLLVGQVTQVMRQARKALEEAKIESENLKGRLSQMESHRDQLQREVDRVSTNDLPKLAKYKERCTLAENGQRQAHMECEVLRNELAKARQDLKANDLVKTASLERYKKRARIAEASQIRLQAGCERLRDEMAQVKEELGSQIKKLMVQLRDPSRELSNDKLRYSMWKDEEVDRALHRLTVVNDHPAEALQAIAQAQGLAYTIDQLSKDKQAMLTRHQTFTETELRFGESKQHGYLLYPHCHVTSDEKGLDVCTTGSLALHAVTSFEAFLQKAEVWYYIGTFRAFKICKAPWETFLDRTDQVDEVKLALATTSAARIKHTECLQQFCNKSSAGKLTAIYIGLECLGFNHKLYEALCSVSKSLRAMQGSGEKRAFQDESGVDGALGDSDELAEESREKGIRKRRRLPDSSPEGNEETEVLRRSARLSKPTERADDS